MSRKNVIDHSEASRINREGTEPEFLRLPKPPKRCALTGLTRASLNTLILGDNPKVRSVVVKQPGTARGVRLVHKEALIGFLNSEMLRQEEERKSPANGSGEGKKETARTNRMKRPDSEGPNGGEENEEYKESKNPNRKENMSKNGNDKEGSSLPPKQMIFEIMQEVVKVPKRKGKIYKDIDPFCWKYPGSGRYGQKWFNGKRWAVHQAMLEDALQQRLPEGLEVRHQCDRLRCCNPAHLWTGTSLDNALDREIRMRAVLKGEDHPLVRRPECRSRGEKHFGKVVSEETKKKITRDIEALGTDENVILSIAVFRGVNRDVVDQLAEGARDEK